MERRADERTAADERAAADERTAAPVAVQNEQSRRPSVTADATASADVTADATVTSDASAERAADPPMEFSELSKELQKIELKAQLRTLGPLSRDVYVSKSGVLRDCDYRGYHAAGIFIWRASSDGESEASAAGASTRNAPAADASTADASTADAGDAPPVGEPSVLLILEKRGNHLRLNFIGGKRDYLKETPPETAIREVEEETRGGLNAASFDRMRAGGGGGGGEGGVRVRSLGPVLWQSESKYALYMHELTEPTDCELVLAVSGGQSLRGGGGLFDVRPAVDMVGTKVRGLRWVALRHLLDERWRRRSMHPFASEMAHALREHIEELCRGQGDGRNSHKSETARVVC